jgi:tetratricopeptide (TPR) repeat protein
VGEDPGRPTVEESAKRGTRGERGTSDGDTQAAAARPETLREAGARAEGGAEALALARGATIGRYTIIRRIGAGGMGVVYLAFDPELDRRVAVKLLRTTAAAPGSEGPARLVREAQVMAKLSHPNVITVFDVGTFGNDVFVAMEYVKGSTLREWAKAAPRSAAETIAICVQAGRGLAAAHAQGILHRDFKPENILVDEQGRAKVLDFGLARSGERGAVEEPAARFELDDTLVGRRSSVSLPETQVGAVVGTPAYMAPEQLRSMAIDPRSDQFAFAITVFEALYGQRPFEGETLPDLLASMQKGRLPPPPPSARGVPRGVFPALAKGLAFEPAARFRSMDELLAALEGAAARIEWRRNFGALAVGALLVAGGIIVTLTREPRAAACSAIDQALGGVWDAPARGEVATAFKAVGGTSAEESLQRVTKALDDYAAGWVTMSTEACVATRVRGVQSDEALDLRSGCLRQRLDDVRALTDLLRHADAPLIDNALAGALRLRPLAACADVRALRAAYAPLSEDKRSPVEALRHDIANLVAWFNAGRCREAMPLATDVAARAKAVGYVPVEAEAFYWAGRTAGLCRDPRTSSDYLFEAESGSEESHQDELSANVLVALADVQGSGLSRYEEGMSLARIAEARIRRIGGSDAILATLARARGWIEYTHGNIEAALPYRREALDRHRRALGDDDPDALQFHAELADLEFEAGHLAAALTAQRELVDRSIAMLGAGALRTGRYVLDVGETLVAEGQYEEAAPWLDRARATVTAGVLEHSKYVDAIERFGLGEVDRGAAELRAVVAIGEHDVGPNDPYPLSTRSDLAKWLAVHRRAEAGDVASAVIAQIASVKGEENPWYSNAYAALALVDARAGRVKDRTTENTAKHAISLAEHGAGQLPYALLALGEVLLARGDVGAAREPLERAMTLVTERGGIDPIIQGDLDFALARALWGADRARATDLAQSAKRAYAASREPSFGGIGRMDR